LHPRFYLLLLPLILSGFGSISFAQTNSSHSPLSRFGLGQNPGIGLTRNEAMAGAGSGSPSGDHPNFLNAAMLSFNEKVNLNLDLRYQYQRLKVGNASAVKGASGQPAFISFVIPIKRGFSMAAGVRPFTNRDFNYSQKTVLGADTLGLRTRGTGGTTQVFLAGGYKIHKNIRVGLETSYVFGTLQDSVIFGILPSDKNFSFINLSKRRISQITFKPSLHLNFPISEEENTYFGIGAGADVGGAYATKTYNTFSIKGVAGETDTLGYGDKSSLQSAKTYKVGFGYYKPLNWSLNADFEYISTSGLLPDQGQSYTYKDAKVARLGFEVSPGTKRSTRYFNIITFRGGVVYEQLPYQLGGKFITNQRVSLGASFPIIRNEAKFSRPLINIGVSYGKRGLKNSYVGVENYWLVNLSFTLNDFLWFNRYKID